MYKKIKYFVAGLSIAGLLIAGSVSAQMGGGIASPGLFKKVGSAVVMISDSLSLGSSSDRISKGWFDDIDTTSITISGGASGDLDMGGYDILDIGQGFFADGTVTDLAVGFDDQSGVGMYRRGSNLLSFATNGALVGEFSSSGFNVNRITALTGDIINTTSRIDQEITKTLSSDDEEYGIYQDITVDGVTTEGLMGGLGVSIASDGYTGEMSGLDVVLEGNASDDGGNAYLGAIYEYQANGALGDAIGVTVEGDWTRGLELWGAGGIRSYNQEFVIDNFRDPFDVGDGDGYDTHIYGGSPAGSGDLAAGDLILELYDPIGAGLDGDFLFKVQGSTVATIDAGGGLSTDGGRWKNMTTVNSATYSTTSSDHIIHHTYSSTGVSTTTLSTADCTDGRALTINDGGGNAGTYQIVVDTEGSETIDGVSSAIINGNGDDLEIYCESSNWFVIN